jgi:hypothetical protein
MPAKNSSTAIHVLIKIKTSVFADCKNRDLGEPSAFADKSRHFMQSQKIGYLQYVDNATPQRRLLP